MKNKLMIVLGLLLGASISAIVINLAFGQSPGPSNSTQTFDIDGTFTIKEHCDGTGTLYTDYNCDKKITAEEAYRTMVDGGLWPPDLAEIMVKQQVKRGDFPIIIKPRVMPDFSVP
jgi:hypothetical protein